MVAEERTIAGVTKTIGYPYNLDGSLAPTTYPDGRTANYTFNGANEMTSANGANYTYAGDGLRVEKSSGTLHWPPHWAAGQASAILRGRGANPESWVANASTSRLACG